MCAIYEPKLRFRFHQLFAAGVSCPRQALAGSRIRLLDAVDPTVLDNVNEPEQYRRAVAGESHGRG
jgi:hypothetical protein